MSKTTFTNMYRLVCSCCNLWPKKTRKVFNKWIMHLGDFIPQNPLATLRWWLIIKKVYCFFWIFVCHLKWVKLFVIIDSKNIYSRKMRIKWFKLCYIFYFDWKIYSFCIKFVFMLFEIAQSTIIFFSWMKITKYRPKKTFIISVMNTHNSLFSHNPIWERNIRRSSFHWFVIDSVYFKSYNSFKIPPTTLLLIYTYTFKDFTNNFSKYFFYISWFNINISIGIKICFVINCHKVIFFPFLFFH